MKCKDVDIIEYIEGMASKNILTHIQACRTCTSESEKISRFIEAVSTRYSEGKNLEEELDSELGDINISKMKKLPEYISEKIAKLRKKSLTARLKKIVGKSGKDLKGVLDRLMDTQLQGMPASPKDITRTKKKKKSGKPKMKK